MTAKNTKSPENLTGDAAEAAKKAEGVKKLEQGNEAGLKQPGQPEQTEKLPQGPKDAFDRFMEKVDKMPPTDGRHFFGESLEFDRMGDITALRKAGTSEAENLKDPSKKHLLLAHLYLQKTANPREFTFDSGGNKTAENYIGLGDILPVNVKAVRVVDKDGSVVSERAFRAINPKNGRIGYFDEALYRQTGARKYVRVLTGTHVTVLDVNNDNDPTLERHKFAENMALYQTLHDPIRREHPSLRTNTASFATGTPETGRSHDHDHSQSLGNGELPGRSLEQGQTSMMTRDLCKQLFGDTPQKVDKFMVRENPLKPGQTLNFLGREMAVANKAILPYLMDAEKEIRAYMQAHSVDYKVKDMQCLAWRPIRGSKTGALSYHLWGIAFDMNPENNAQGSRQTDIPEWLINIMKSKGFRWGGDWKGRYVDPMHFEFAGDPRKELNKIQSAEWKQYAKEVMKELPPVEQPAVVPASFNQQGIQSSANPETQQPAHTEYASAIANRPTTDLNKIAEDHRFNLSQVKILPEYQKAIEQFRNLVLPNKARYEQVAQKTGVPWKLIAALHYRESTCNFNTYMHNGDPLRDGSGNSIPTTHVPRGLLFNSWESSAIDALTKRTGDMKNKLGIDQNNPDLAKYAAFAERYNGLGYRNQHPETVSPYVYSGTNLYIRGKYASDGKYDPNLKDKQLGVVTMVMSLNDVA